MSRYFIEFAYDGTNYHGWQTQKTGISVQEVLNKALSLLLQAPIDTVGAGRTDTGVHATQMFAHFDWAGDRGDIQPEQLVYKLNRLLPYDISIQRIFPVADDIHARFSAKHRTYEYHFILEKNPFLHQKAWLLHKVPHWKKMEEAAEMLFQFKEFDAFCKSNANSFTTLCDIFQSELLCRDGRVIYRVSANRFLRNMVRAIVGTLMEVGYEKITPDDFAAVIASKQRTKAGASAPAHGLYLVEVGYDAFSLPYMQQSEY